MRIVLDVNVIVSAFIKPDGIPGTILTQIFTNSTYVLLISEEIMNELRSVLKCPKVMKYIQLPNHQLEFWLTSIEIIAHDVSPRFKYNTLVKEDPKDDAYLIAAIEGNADFIISGDKHLLNLNPYESIPILKPSEFVKSFLN